MKIEELEKKLGNHKSRQAFLTSKRVLHYLNKVLICTLIFITFLIATRQSESFKKLLYSNVYQDSFSFASVKGWYQKYFGSVLPLDNIIEHQVSPVFKEKLTYEEANLYKNGVSLTVGANYLIPVLDSGMVVFVGEKEGYGMCVIIQQLDGVDVWYGNLASSNIKIYDYVEKGSLLGEAKDNSLYLVFQKDGQYLDYKDYINNQ